MVGHDSEEHGVGDVDITSASFSAAAPPGNAVTDRRDAKLKVGFLGTGLGAPALVALIGISTVAFLFWGGPLWRVPPGTSHVARIAGSYLIAVPLVAATLVLARRLTLQHLLGSVGVVWSAKLVITATSYAFVAPSSATEYAPARTWEGAESSSGAANGKRFTPGASVGTSGISGRISLSGLPIADVAVVVDDFDSGVSNEPSQEVAMTIEQARYERNVYLVSPRDRLAVTNRDAVLHTVRILKDQHAVANVPIPPGSSPYIVALPSPGAYEISCESHPSEQAVLVVGDRRVTALADVEGRFAVGGLAAGEHELLLLRPRHAPIRRSIRLAPDTISALSIELE